jgi:hypothetical protein
MSVMNNTGNPSGNALFIWAESCCTRDAQPKWLDDPHALTLSVVFVAS